MTSDIANENSSGNIAAAVMQVTAVPSKPSSFFRLPVELRIMIFHNYILDHPSALYNPRKTIYEGPELLKSDKHEIERAQTYIYNSLPQESLHKIVGPAFFRIPSNELGKAFAQFPSLNEHIFHVNSVNLSSLEKWKPPLPITDYTRICLAINLYSYGTVGTWIRKFETTFPKQFIALKHIHIYFEAMTTGAEWWVRIPTKSTKSALQEALMEMPSVETVTISWGTRVDRAPNEQFAYYRETDHDGNPPFLHYFCKSTKDAFGQWITHDDPSRNHLLPGQAYDLKQRQRDRLEYEEYMWAVYVNCCPNYKHLKGLTFQEKMVEVMKEGEKERATLGFREWMTWSGRFAVL
ncbi:hypothetical protein E2P81_ATG02448 [Venturia nashicola]|nr:hypothetical protein E2P81_ATG02448 [Venturia nashicola]